MRAGFVWGIVSLLAGCNTGNDGPSERPDIGRIDTDTDVGTDSADTGDSGDSGDTGTPAPCPMGRFAAVGTDVALPTDYGADAFPSAEAVGRDKAWVLRDLDGDGRPELVVTHVAEDTDVVPRRWRVHVLGVDGFDPVARDWRLPDSLPPESLTTWTDDRPAATNWRVLDMDGDGRVDLLVTQQPGDDTVGTSSWRVWRGTVDGFAAAAETWSLPMDRGPGAFAAPDKDADASPNWSLTDMDGDGRPDLVVMRDDASASTALGQTEWWVYGNDGGAFAAEPRAWALPGGIAPDTFAAAEDDPDVSPDWSLADLDADGRMDLVLTYDEADTTGLGTTRWTVWRNAGDRFEEMSMEWSLPAAFEVGTFRDTVDRDKGGAAWALRDLSGDGRLDLVVTSDEAEPADGVTPIGLAEWHLYVGAEARFGPEAAPFVLPTGYPEDAFLQPSAPDGGPTWTLQDLTGDGAVDLVVTSWRGGTAEGLGDSRWSVHAASCVDE